MAAPSNIYKSYTFKDYIGTSLQGEYKFVTPVSPYATEEELKSLFKLDGVMKKIDENGEMLAFCGYTTPNSYNSHYHKVSRRGITFKIENLYYDGGVNRYADSQIVKVLNTETDNVDSLVENYPPTVTSSRVFFWFYSPIFNPLSSGLIEVSSDNVNWFTLFTKGSMSANTETQNAYYDNSPFFATAGTYYLRITATNDEGSKTDVNYTVVIGYASDIMKYNLSNASDAFNGSFTKVVYRNTREYIAYDSGANYDASILYLKNSQTNEFEVAPTGYYVLDNTWYYFGYNTELNRYSIISRGLCQPGGYPSGDPGNIVHNFELVTASGYGRDSLSTARTEVLSGNYDYRDLYLEQVVNYETSTEIWYAWSDENHTVQASVGYYVFGEKVLGITRELVVESGVVVDDTGWL